ncbi:MAG TPA: M24 family metallopeptidase [Candidatus Binatus sp.]|uniref:M24 family metallopeptidase n=1 Tax=Candidatus Binatus sp. TaxID=2811406 RepID=UPI002B459918|nr:M24 family metallopeptidase [Candidatus Binatus sp.]HKN14480.1 M24 family metallopeptidase [Candidatus Binatus sp.]
MGRTLQQGFRYVTARVHEIALALGHAQLDGWLFYDFRLSDPLAYRILGLSEDGIATRRWFCFVPAHGKPRAIVSAVEAHRLDALGAEKIVYRSHNEMVSALRAVLGGARRVAMDYSPGCAIPYVSRVDAGTVEIVRAMGIEVVTAADLIQRFEATLTREQLASHQRAARALRSIVDETFAEIAQLISAGRPVSEVSVQESVMARFAAQGLVTHAPPIVAVNEHSADPHYGPTSRHDRAIRRGDFILLDLWAKQAAPDSIYADFTWVAFAGNEVPDEHARVFEIVARARDATVELVQRRVAAGEPVSGRETDRAARSVIEAAGFGDAFVHRTGHSIGREVHGTGANLDSLETLDDRSLIDTTCFSVEPGIYLPNKFGVRSELDMTIEDGRALVSGEPRQREIVALLAAATSKRKPGVAT